MSIDATLLLLLAVCCWVLLALQASLWPRWLCSIGFHHDQMLHIGRPVQV